MRLCQALSIPMTLTSSGTPRWSAPSTTGFWQGRIRWVRDDAETSRCSSWTAGAVSFATRRLSRTKPQACSAMPPPTWPMPRAATGSDRRSQVARRGAVGAPNEPCVARAAQATHTTDPSRTRSRSSRRLQSHARHARRATGPSVGDSSCPRGFPPRRAAWRVPQPRTPPDQVGVPP